jgi:hypothetical protein
MTMASPLAPGEKVAPSKPTTDANIPCLVYLKLIIF